MTWHKLNGLQSEVAPEPTPAQLAAAATEWNKPPHPGVTPAPNFVTAKVFLSKLSEVEQAAITAEAIKQFAANATQLPRWWARVSKGYGMVQLTNPNVKAIEALLVANGVLTQAVADTAFSAP